MRRGQQVVDQERDYPASYELVSTTDTRGIITYANDAFCKVAGYEGDELVGKNHNIVRHPDMPKAAFKDMWDNLEQGKSWRGVVKNLCKDGKYYWVDAFVTPIMENGKRIGYQSVRVKPSRELVDRASRLYSAVNANKLNVLKEWQTSTKMAIFTATTLLLAVMGSLWAGWPVGVFVVLTALLPAILFNNELFSLPGKANQLKQQFDSVSRLIYAGKGVSSIYEFHLGIEQALQRTVLGRTQDSARHLSDIASQTLSYVNQTNTGIHQQRQGVGQISKAVESLSHSSQSVLESTAETSRSIELTDAQCGQAKELIIQGRDKVKDLSGIVERASQTADSLMQAADNVARTMGEIEAIAEQTNLLALNAAIEAARAGDSGRGFAVVADEVRALSTRTQESAGNIVQSMGLMRSTLNEWVDTMHETRENALQSVAQADESAEAIGQIYAMIEKINAHSQQIMQAVQNQEQVCSEIVQNVDGINAVAEDNAKVSESMAETANTLNRNIEKIVALSDTFLR